MRNARVGGHPRHSLHHRLRRLCRHRRQHRRHTPIPIEHHPTSLELLTLPVAHVKAPSLTPPAAATRPTPPIQSRKTPTSTAPASTPASLSPDPPAMSP